MLGIIAIAFSYPFAFPTRIETADDEWIALLLLLAIIDVRTNTQ